MAFIKTVAVLNLLAALGFAALLVIGTIAAELDARMKFTQLDRQGVINAPAFAGFDASYGFGDVSVLAYRGTVPVWLCGSALAFLQGNAVLGLVVSATNAALAIVAWVRQIGPKKGKLQQHDPELSNTNAAQG
jgi:hypothetical protein